VKSTGARRNARVQASAIRRVVARSRLRGRYSARPELAPLVAESAAWTDRPLQVGAVAQISRSDDERIPAARRARSRCPAEKSARGHAVVSFARQLGRLEERQRSIRRAPCGCRISSGFCSTSALKSEGSRDTLERLVLVERRSSPNSWPSRGGWMKRSAHPGAGVEARTQGQADCAAMRGRRLSFSV